MFEKSVGEGNVIVLQHIDNPTAGRCRDEVRRHVCVSVCVEREPSCGLLLSWQWEVLALGGLASDQVWHVGREHGRDT